MDILAESMQRGESEAQAIIGLSVCNYSRLHFCMCYLHALNVSKEIMHSTSTRKPAFEIRYTMAKLMPFL